MGYDAGGHVEVPIFPTAQFIQWCYENQDHVRLVDEQHRLLSLPEPAVLREWTLRAKGGGFEWILADGPRPARPQWVLDFWWTDRPELTQELLTLTSSGCMTTQSVLDALPEPEVPEDAL